MRMRLLVWWVLLLFGLLVLHAHGQTATKIRLIWDPNPPTDNVAGYVVYWGTTSRGVNTTYEYPHSATVGSTTLSYEILGLPSGVRYYVSAKAFNGAGVFSGYATEISSVIPTPDPDPGTDPDLPTLSRLRVPPP